MVRESFPGGRPFIDVRMKESAAQVCGFRRGCVSPREAEKQDAARPDVHAAVRDAETGNVRTGECVMRETGTIENGTVGFGDVKVDERASSGRHGSQGCRGDVEVDEVGFLVELEDGLEHRPHDDGYLGVVAGGLGGVRKTKERPRVCLYHDVGVVRPQ